MFGFIYNKYEIQITQDGSWVWLPAWLTNSVEQVGIWDESISPTNKM